MWGKNIACNAARATGLGVDFKVLAEHAKLAKKALRALHLCESITVYAAFAAATGAMYSKLGPSIPVLGAPGVVESRT